MYQPSSREQVQVKFTKVILILIITLCIIEENFATGCLITNCPRGGKRSGKYSILEPNSVKQCISCGPGGLGQCYGSKICCGPFGCLLGTPETFRCQQEGLFSEIEPCIAGTKNCRKNTGRCAMDEICCSQDSCHIDKQCKILDGDRKIGKENLSALELFNILGYETDNMLFDK